MSSNLIIWGSNENGKLNIPDAFNTGSDFIRSGENVFKKISLGYDHVVAQYLNNYLIGWGNNSLGQNNFSRGYTMTDFDAGINTNYFVDSYGRIHGLGQDILFSDVYLYTGQIICPQIFDSLSINEGGLPQPLSNYNLGIKSVKAGSGYVLALTTGGKITGWGTFAIPPEENIITGNISGDLRTGFNINFNSILNSGSYVTVNLTGDWSGFRALWTQSSNGTTFTGLNLYNSNEPYLSGSSVQDSGLGPAIYNGYLDKDKNYLRVILTGNGTTPTTSGSGNLGVLITGYLGNQWQNKSMVINHVSFNRINSIGKVKDIAAGYNHALALFENGVITGWGDNLLGQLSFNTSNLSGLMSGVKISTKTNENLILGAPYPIITNIATTGLVNSLPTGWKIDYKDNRLGVTGLVVETSLDKIVWNKNSLQLGNQTVSGSGINFDNLNYYVRLISLASSIPATGMSSIFNPGENIFTQESDYKLYNQYTPYLQNKWAERTLWKEVLPGKTGDITGVKLSQVLFNRDGSKQMLCRELDVLRSEDFGIEWFYNQNPYNLSGYKTSLSPDGDTWNLFFNTGNITGFDPSMDDPNSYPNWLFSLILYNLNINSNFAFSNLRQDPISMAIDELQTGVNYPFLPTPDLRTWIETGNYLTDILSDRFDFQFKNSHSSDLYTVLIGGSGENDSGIYKVDPNGINTTLNSSGRLWLYSNWKTGIYTGYLGPDPIGYDIIVKSLNDRYLFPYSPCPDCPTAPQEFYERTATIKSDLYTGIVPGKYYWKIAKITDKKNVYGIVQNDVMGTVPAYISFSDGSYINTRPSDNSIETYLNPFSGNYLIINGINKNWVDFDISEDGQYQTAVANQINTFNNDNPLIPDTFFNFNQKLTGDAGLDRWGTSVATNSIGDIIVVGGPLDSGGSGGAVVYTGNPSVGWGFRSKLTGDGGIDNWGASVAINGSGNIIVLGGTGDGGGSGAALVYTGSSTAGWGFRSKLTGDAGLDRWGTSLAINGSGNVIVIGGTGDGGGSGAAIVYTGNPTAGWAFRSKLTGDAGLDRWGTSLAINGSGDVIVIGGPFDSGGSGGAVVYTGNPSVGWGFRSKLTGDGGIDNWGASVAINGSGNIIVLGGTGDGGGSGAALVYTGSSTAGWVYKSKLTGDSGADRWGVSLTDSSDGNVIVLGGSLDNSNSGAAIVYTGNPTAGWTFKQKLIGDAGTDRWSTSLAMNSGGNILIMGGTGDSDGSGAAIIFQNVIQNSSGFIWRSETSGLGWSEVGIYSGKFNKLKVSANGKYQILLNETGNNIEDIWSSNDYGKSWIPNNFYNNWIDVAVANNGLQAVISPNNLYYNYFKNYNENFLKVQNKQILDISAGYNSNLVLTKDVILNEDDNLDYIDLTENNLLASLDYSKIIIQDSWFPGVNSLYVFLEMYNTKPSYRSITGNFNYISGRRFWSTDLSEEVFPVGDISGQLNIMSGIVSGTFKDQYDYEFNSPNDYPVLITGLGALTPGSGSATNNFIKWYKNRWNVYSDYNKLIYYSSEDTFYPWEIENWSGLTTGATGTFAEFNPGYYLKTGYTGGNFGTITKYTEPTVYDVIECTQLIFDDPEYCPGLGNYPWISTSLSGIETEITNPGGAPFIGTPRSFNSTIGMGNVKTFYTGQFVSTGIPFNQTVSLKMNYHSFPFDQLYSGFKKIVTGWTGINTFGPHCINLDSGSFVKITCSGNNFYSLPNLKWFSSQKNPNQLTNDEKLYWSGSLNSFNLLGGDFTTGGSPMNMFLENTFNFKQKLTGDAGVDNWGYSVAMNSGGNILIMGGTGDNGGSGAVIIYTGNSAGGWDFRQKLTGDGGTDRWGLSVATNSSGNVIVVGGPLDNGGSGAAIVYTGNPTQGWGFRSKLTGDGGVDNWGISVATNSSGNIIVLGSILDNTSRGAATIYTGNPTAGWSFRSKLTGDVGAGADRWGYSVATNSSGNVIVLGGILDNSSNGAVAVYTGDTTAGWAFKSKLTGDSGADRWGNSVAISSSGDMIVFGGPLDNENSGAAIIYTGNPTAGWFFKQKLTGDGGSDRWGWSVATNGSGNVIVVGGPLDSGGSGAAIVYRINSIGDWVPKQKLTGDGGIDNWGTSIAINNNGDTIVLGGNLDNSSSGAVIVYNNNLFSGAFSAVGYLPENDNFLYISGNGWPDDNLFLNISGNKGYYNLINCE